MSSILVRNISGVAPLARPESGLDDSDLEDDPPSRISKSWKDYTLSTVQQSSDSLDKPRPRASTENFASRKSNDVSPKSSSFSSLPPPKPPRTFETERFEGRQSFRIKVPPKPPRTFEHDSQSTLNYCSLDWNFPRHKGRAVHTCSHNSLDGSREYFVDSEVRPPYSSHKRYRRLEENISNGHQDPGNFPVGFESPGAESRGGAPAKFEARFSFSDSVVNISPEETLLLGSVKPRRGRRSRQKALQRLSHEVSAEQLASAKSAPGLSASLLETPL